MIANSEDKIINAIIEVFAKRGFDIATTDEIAKRSGISKGTVFLRLKKERSDTKCSNPFSSLRFDSVNHWWQL